MRFKTGLAVAAGALPASLVLIILFLTIYAWPAILFNGFHFVTSNTWNLGNLYGEPTTLSGTPIMPGAHYGILFLIVGTLLSTLIALLIAVPVGVGARGIPRRGGAGAIAPRAVVLRRDAGGGAERGVQPVGLCRRHPFLLPYTLSADGQRLRLHPVLWRPIGERLWPADLGRRAVADDRAADRRDAARCSG